MKDDYSYTTETLVLPYRRPVWQGGEVPALQPAEMTVRRVRAVVGTCGRYPASRAMAAEFGVPPVLAFGGLREPDFNGGQREPVETTLLVATEPGPFVEREERVRSLLETGWPLDGQGEAWRTYEQAVFDEDPSNGWLIRLGWDTMPLPFPQPRIDVTGEADVTDMATRHGFAVEEDGDRVFMGEGEYVEAKLLADLEKATGRDMPWDHSERHRFYMGVPHVQQVVADFRAGRPLPETWVRWNLAYAVRAAWLLRWWLGRAWDEADDIQAAAAFESSIFGEFNHV